MERWSIDLNHSDKAGKGKLSLQRLVTWLKVMELWTKKPSTYQHLPEATSALIVEPYIHSAS
jgi:hypothetical protein